MPYRAAPGRGCIRCEEESGWEAHAGPAQRLVIDAAAIDASLSRRTAEQARLPRWRRLAAAVPALVATVAAAGAIASCAWLLAPAELGPLDEMRRRDLLPASLEMLAGLIALVAGIISIVRLRRGHLHRAWWLTGASAAAIAVGVPAMIHAGLGLALAGPPPGWSSELEPLSDSTMPGRGIEQARATIVLLAASDLGLTIGMGVIVHSEPGRAEALTCSHVAMPDESPAAWRDAARAARVFAYLSDGRCLEARITWVAPPPIDAALVEILAENPPPAVPIRASTADLGEASLVSFVPNPLRSGWRADRGRVLRRETHATPAGEVALFHTSLDVQPGDSGSGLFDEEGSLIGLNTWRVDGARGPHGVSLPSDVVRDMMHELAR